MSQPVFEFPRFVYVHEPLSALDESGSFDCYATWQGAQEDDTLAIYSLVGVCRVKKQVKTILVDEKDHNKIVRETGEC